MKDKIIYLVIIFSGFSHFGWAQFSVDVNQQMGIKMFNAGEYEKAIPYFEKVLKNDSAATASYYHLGIAYLMTNQAQKALQISKLGVNYAVEKDAMFWLQAEASLNTGNMEEALLIYQQFKQGKYSIEKLQVKPSDLMQRLQEVNLVIASEAMKNKQYKKALKHFNQVDNKQGQILLNEAFAHFHLGNLQQSITLLNKIDDQQLQKEVQQLRAAVLFKQENWEALTNEYETVYDEAPSLANGLLYAELLQQSNQLNQAQVIYGELIQKFPKEKDPYQKLIRIYESQLDYSKKATILKYMASRMGYEEDTYLSLANTYVLLEKYDTARLYFDTLRQHNCHQDVVYNGILNTYYQQKKWKDAEEYILQLIDENKGTAHAKYQHDLGQVYYQQKDLLSAINAFKSINYHDQYSAAIANIYQESVSIDSAHTYYTRSVHHGFTDPLAMYQLGKVYQKSQRNDSAVYFMQKSLQAGINGLVSKQNVLQQKIQSDGLLHSAKHQPLVDSIAYFDEAINTAIDFIIYYFSYHQAKEILSDLSKRNRSSDHLLYYLSFLHYHHGYYDQALQQLNLSLAQNTSNQLSHLLMGKIFMKQEKPELARQSFERVITINQENEEAYALLLEIYQVQNKLEDFKRKLEHWYQVKANEITKEYLLMVYHKLELYELAANLKQK